MPPRRRPMRPAALVVLLAACASGGKAPAAGPAEGTTFAPSLGVDLPAMTRTGGGVYVRDLRPGAGRTATRGMQVRVRYTGWLPDGTPVDSTAAADAPVAFRLGNRDVIAGWEQGLVGMRVGGRRQLVVPPRLGYGARGAGAVPPDAVLVFAIDLVDAR